MPITLVVGSIDQKQLAIPVLDASEPLTLVYVAVVGDESAVTLILVLFEPSLVSRSLGIAVIALSFAYIGASDQLALVISVAFVFFGSINQIQI